MVVTGICRLLAAEGFVVTAVATIDELDRAEFSARDLLILDVDNPSCANGSDMFQLIEALRERGFDCPIIATTNPSIGSAHSKRTAAHEVQVMSYLSKPVDGQALIDTVKFALHR